MLSPSCSGQNIACAGVDFLVYSLGFFTFTVGSAVGAWAIGEQSGQEGSFLATFNGALAGLLLAVLASESDLGVAILAVGAPLGSTIGYQLSLDNDAPQPSFSGETSLQLVHLKF